MKTIALLLLLSVTSCATSKKLKPVSVRQQLYLKSLMGEADEVPYDTADKGCVYYRELHQNR